VAVLPFVSSSPPDTAPDTASAAPRQGGCLAHAPAPDRRDRDGPRRRRRQYKWIVEEADANVTRPQETMAAGIRVLNEDFRQQRIDGRTVFGERPRFDLSPLE